MFLFALAMAAHALVIGRYLESMFFLTAFSWGWTAFAALVQRLDAAWAMGLTMIAILLVLSSLLLFGASPYGQEELIPLYSLALVPSLVSWGCLLALTRYISTNHADDIGNTSAMPVATATAQGLASYRSTTPAIATFSISQGVLGESADMAMNDNERRGLTVEQVQDAPARLKLSSLH